MAKEVQESDDRLEQVGHFIQALRLVRLAQKVSGQPVDLVAQLMTRLPRLPSNLSPRAAAVAAGRAGRWYSRLTRGLDSCLVRTLVTGALLSDRPGVVLHVGFRPSPGDGTPHDGHAWLTVKGRELPEATMTAEPGEPFTELKAIPLARSAGGQ